MDSTSLVYLVSWLRGAAVIIDNTSVRETAGSEMALALSEVSSLHVARQRQGLTAAVLVATTSAGEVVFDHMVASWGQVTRLEKIADQLNERLAGDEGAG
ncbi:hypothetical protein BJ980_001587 [Nocardioides daedukensis]|uniref:Uncharacterized protein n=1 Tax=Nocardioides daedukensis TaxID=634462 RepID=A0A7Y9UTN2_9ACTN|nr:hypothetical protein [Nocardioides daedukensis]NYG58664.1 hypothetical protein [Nocardioides daedukensis]